MSLCPILWCLRASTILCHVGALHFSTWSTFWKKDLPVGGALMPNIFCSNTSQNAQLRANTLSLETAWTGFDPNLYSGGTSSAGPALVEIATARSFLYSTGALWLTQCQAILLWRHQGKLLSLRSLLRSAYWAPGPVVKSRETLKLVLLLGRIHKNHFTICNSKYDAWDS